MPAGVCGQSEIPAGPEKLCKGELLENPILAPQFND